MSYSKIGYTCIFIGLNTRMVLTCSYRNFPILGLVSMFVVFNKSIMSNWVSFSLIEASILNFLRNFFSFVLRLLISYLCLWCVVTLCDSIQPHIYIYKNAKARILQESESSRSSDLSFSLQKSFSIMLCEFYAMLKTSHLL